MYRRIVAARIRAVWRAVDAGDREAPARLATENMTFRFVGDTPLGTELVGRDAFRSWFNRVFEQFPGIQFTVRDVLVAGWPWDTRAAVRLGVTATLADGTPYRNEAVQMVRLRWGRMVDDWVLEDTAALTDAVRRQSLATAATA